MKVKDLMESCCDEDQLFTLQDYEDEIIRNIWLSDYRHNKEGYPEVIMEVESWAANLSSITVWVK